MRFRALGCASPGGGAGSLALDPEGPALRTECRARRPRVNVEVRERQEALLPPSMSNGVSDGARTRNIWSHSNLDSFGALRPGSQFPTPASHIGARPAGDVGGNRLSSPAISGNLPARDRRIPDVRFRAIDGGRDRLLTVAEVAERLGVRPCTIYKLVSHGELSHVRISNAIRIAPDDLATFVAARRPRQ